MPSQYLDVVRRCVKAEVAHKLAFDLSGRHLSRLHKLSGLVLQKNTHLLTLCSAVLNRDQHHTAIVVAECKLRPVAAENNCVNGSVGFVTNKHLQHRETIASWKTLRWRPTSWPSKFMMDSLPLPPPTASSCPPGWYWQHRSAEPRSCRLSQVCVVAFQVRNV